MLKSILKYPVIILSYAILTLLLITASMNLIYKEIYGKFDIQNCAKDFLFPVEPPAGESIYNLFTNKNTCNSSLSALAFLLYQKGYAFTDENTLLKLSGQDHTRLNIQSLINILNKLELNGTVFRSNLETLKNEDMPVLALYNDLRFVVIVQINNTNLFIFDPKDGYISVDKNLFLTQWNGLFLKVTVKTILLS